MSPIRRTLSIALAALTVGPTCASADAVDEWIEIGRVGSSSGTLEASRSAARPGPEPPDVGLWWQAAAEAPIDPNGASLPIGIETLILETLDGSPAVEVSRHTAGIARQEIVRRDAEFDVNWLLDSTMDRQNDPVGNTLTTGGPPRLIRNGWDSSAGLQKTTRRGGGWDVSQSLGLLDSNSTFFSPGNQASTRLAVNWNQPLFDRGGTAYATRFVTAARIADTKAWSESEAVVRQQLVDALTAYWELRSVRSRMIQLRDLQRRTEAIRLSIVRRSGWDAGGIDVAKVRYREAMQAAAIADLAAGIVDTQMRLGRAVGSDAVLALLTDGEVLPVSRPSPDLDRLRSDATIGTGINPSPQRPIDGDAPGTSSDVAFLVETALSNRAEMAIAAADIEQAALDLNVARVELRPRLNLIIGGYLAGLSGDYRGERSFVDQFTTGGPGLTGGFEYSLPGGTRAARAAHRQASLRLRVANAALRQAMQTVHAEVVSAVARRDAAAEAIGRRLDALSQAVTEERLLTQRYQSDADETTGFGLITAALLDAHRRRTDAEAAVSQSMADWAIAVVMVNAACGTLLRRFGVSTGGQAVVSEPAQPSGSGGAATPMTDPSVRNAGDGRPADFIDAANDVSTTGDAGGPTSSTTSSARHGAGVFLRPHGSVTFDALTVWLVGGGRAVPC